MSTPDEPETPQLTRRQLRELRNTASNPVISPDADETAVEPSAPVVAPLPRAAEPAPVSEEPPAASEIDLEAPALTRRNARRQERIRTASIPVIYPTAPLEQEASADVESVEGEEYAPAADVAEPVEAAIDDAAATEDGDDAPVSWDEVVSFDDVDATPAGEDDAPADSEAEAVAEATPDAEAADSVADELAESQSEAPDVETVEDESDEAAVDAVDNLFEDESEDRPVVAPTFGSGLLAGEGVELELPASFDQLLTRNSPATGAMPASNALILSQTPDTGSFASPVASTGEVLITGTYQLPESFGSTGITRGSTDGKDLDSMFIDGELPASSSPTPIAASAAISTIKSADDIIKPPAPDKGSRLMLVLVITAGALALALTGVLIVALVTGAFQ
ncbi:MAG: hypothetical protein DI566_05640 [Microbacterium sp.]|nr:MAG: hypothetical protein DI566_05640 [Microbacterium sp.]